MTFDRRTKRELAAAVVAGELDPDTAGRLLLARELYRLHKRGEVSGDDVARILERLTPASAETRERGI